MGQSFSTEYQQRVSQYPHLVEQAKASKGKLFQWLVRCVYRPVKRLIPGTVERYLMKRVLAASFPMPYSEDDVIFTVENAEEAPVFVAVCKDRRHT